MPVGTIWVLAESFDGKTLTLTLENLSKARELGSTVEAFAWGPDVDAIVPELGKYGATKVYSAGDIGQHLPGPAVAAAMAETIKGGNAPDAILIGSSYDGRDIAGRLSVKLDVPLLTNVVGLSEDGGPRGGGPPTSGGPGTAKAALEAGRNPATSAGRPKPSPPGG